MGSGERRAEREFTAAAYESPRGDIQRLVPTTARRILDVGCASGGLGSALKLRQPSEVVGLDVNPAYEAEASARLDRFMRVDLDQIGATGFADSIGTFDCVIAADVLEHLVRPWDVLQQLVTILEPRGHVIVSLPNVRYWGMAVNVYLRGTWPRRPVGLFDATHLRWFTARDMRQMLLDAGLTVLETRHVYRLAGRPRRYDDVARHLGPLRELFAYQNQAVAIKTA